MATLRRCEHCEAPLTPSMSGSICMEGCEKRTVQPSLSAIEKVMLQAFVEGHELLEATITKSRVKALRESLTAELPFMSIYRLTGVDTQYRRVYSLKDERDGDVIALHGSVRILLREITAGVLQLIPKKKPDSE